MRPKGFYFVGGFMVFATIMSAFAAITIIWPGTFLDEAWQASPEAHEGLTTLGALAGIGFTTLAAASGASAFGWFSAKKYGWYLAATIIGINCLSDLVRLVTGNYLEGAVGVIIAGLILTYLFSKPVRSYFSGQRPEGYSSNSSDI